MLPSTAVCMGSFGIPFKHNQVLPSVNLTIVSFAFLLFDVKGIFFVHNVAPCKRCKSRLSGAMWNAMKHISGSLPNIPLVLGEMVELHRVYINLMLI